MTITKASTLFSTLALSRNVVQQSGPLGICTSFLLDSCPRAPSAHVIRAVSRQYLRLSGNADQGHQTQEHGRKCVTDFPCEIIEGGRVVMILHKRLLGTR